MSNTNFADAMKATRANISTQMAERIAAGSVFSWWSPPPGYPHHTENAKKPLGQAGGGMDDEGIHNCHVSSNDWFISTDKSLAQWQDAVKKLDAMPPDIAAVGETLKARMTVIQVTSKQAMLDATHLPADDFKKRMLELRDKCKHDSDAAIDEAYARLTEIGKRDPARQPQILQAAQLVGQVVMGYTQTLGSTVVDVANTISDIAKAAPGAVADTAKKAVNTIGDIGKKAIDSIGSIFHGW